jgi:hypothetical protein
MIEPIDIGAESVLVPSASVVAVELDGEAVLYDEEANTVHVLSPTATIVWNLLDSRSDVGSLSNDLAWAYGVEPERMQADVLAAVREFGRKGLLQGVEADPAVIEASVLESPEPKDQG